MYHMATVKEEGIAVAGAVMAGHVAINPESTLADVIPPTVVKVIGVLPCVVVLQLVKEVSLMSLVSLSCRYASVGNGA